MSTLIIGGTGTVGSQVVRLAVAHKVRVRVLTRSADKGSQMPKGAEAVVGDLGRAATLRNAFEGVTSVFMTTPLSQTETEEGLAAVGAAEDAGVRRFVYMTIHRLESAVQIPHFVSKLPVVAAVKASGMEYTFLEPNNFYQNDMWFKDAIEKHGLYPQPIGGIGVSRVDVRDIADAALAALTTEGHAGQSYPLVGPEALTGKTTAEIWSRHAGREVRYGGDDLDAWAAQARQMLPEWMVHDVRIMYEHFQTKGLAATPAELIRQKTILGHAPRSYEEYVKETVKAWKG